jgi:hypothetical protein
MQHRILVALSGSLAFALFTACSDNSTPTQPDFGKIGIECQVGCIDPPPDTVSNPIGYFLGSGVTGTVCFNGSQTDTDGDQLSDFCEKNLALAFAPYLKYTRSDDIGREPKWVAMWLKSGTNVRIAYLLSYYNDWGPVTMACNTNILDLINRELCSGHNGDSEIIALNVSYNPATQRWVLDSAFYSAHGLYHKYLKTAKGYPAMEYYSVQGGAPYSYVSYQKHANYRSFADCDKAEFLGGIIVQDICDPQAVVRVDAGGQLNLGSRAHQLLNCTTSGNPIYAGSGRSECYWTDTQKFNGWHKGSPSATPYSPLLSTLGFK